MNRFLLILLLALFGPACAALGQSSPISILAPETDAVLDSPATTIELRFPVGTAVTLRVNGAPVSPTLIGRTETDSDAKTVTQTWYGVILKEGANTLTAGAGADGKDKVERTVEVQTAPKQLTLRALGTRLPADGRSTLTLTGSLLDGQGHPCRRETMITLTASAGEFAGADADPDQPGFQVRTINGQFTAILRAGVQAQTVHAHAVSDDLEAFTQFEFTTHLRPSLATGVVDVRLGSRQSDYDRPIQDFISPDVSNAVKPSGHAAVFATGKVGDYLFIGAYNSDHPLNQTAAGPSSLGKDTQTSDRQYPLYGDSSTSQALAASRDKLALRLEHNQDFIMWGDYGTPELSGRSQLFTALTREFHALKASYQFGALQTTAFTATTCRVFSATQLRPMEPAGFTFCPIARLSMAVRASFLS